MALTDYPTQLALTSKDYESLRDEILSKIPIITKGKWTNLNSSDPGITLAELLASMIANLYYYQDAISTELYVPSANQRLSLMKLLRVFGYEISLVKSARGNITVSVSSQETEPVSYPISLATTANIQVSAKTSEGSTLYTILTPEEVTGLTTSSYQINSLTEKISIPIIQGVRVTSNKTTFTSDGTQNQRFLVDEANVDTTQFTLKVNNKIWSKVDSFFATIKTSEVYKIEINDQLRPVIVFGDNQFGMIPTYGSIITVLTYTSSGTTGTVGTGAVDSIVTPVVDSTGQKVVKLTVTNPFPIVGGSNIESISAAKENAIGKLVTNNRLVTTEDYVLSLKTTPGVDKVTAWGEQEEQYPNYALMNRVQICFYSKNSWDFNNINHVYQYNAIQNILQKTIEEKIPLTTRFVFVKPKLVDVYISAQLGIDTRNYDPQIVVSQVRTAIKNYYNIDYVTFGQTIHISTISQICNSIPGVLWSQVSRLHTLPVPTYVLDPGAPPVLYPDMASNPPQDLYLAKNELPTVTERTPVINPSMVVPSPPYIVINNFPSIYNYALKNTTSVPEKTSLGKVGSFNIRVVNPDGQEDTLKQGVTIIPNTTQEHISISYIDSAKNMQNKAGYLNKPAGDSALYCPKV